MRTTEHDWDCIARRVPSAECECSAHYSIHEDAAAPGTYLVFFGTELIASGLTLRGEAEQAIREHLEIHES